VLACPSFGLRIPSTKSTRVPAVDNHQRESRTFELSVNANYWEPNRITSEIRPIVDTHLGCVDLIVTPFWIRTPADSTTSNLIQRQALHTTGTIDGRWQ